jgi:hypothetical protein
MATSVLTIDSQMNNSIEQVFGKKIGIIARLFGCSHSRLSRPFSPANGKVGYRCCLQCGARKRFDLETRTTSGAAYYPPTYTALK